MGVYWLYLSHDYHYKFSKNIWYIVTFVLEDSVYWRNTHTAWIIKRSNTDGSAVVSTRLLNRSFYITDCFSSPDFAYLRTRVNFERQNSKFLAFPPFFRVFFLAAGIRFPFCWNAHSPRVIKYIIQHDFILIKIN